MGHVLAVPSAPLEPWPGGLKWLRDQGFRGVPGSGSQGGGDTAETLGFFMKATGSITGASDPIEIPMKDWPDRRYDHEGEIAFVVEGGSRLRGAALIPANDATRVRPPRMRWRRWSGGVQPRNPRASVARTAAPAEVRGP